MSTHAPLIPSPYAWTGSMEHLNTLTTARTTTIQPTIYVLLPEIATTINTVTRICAPLANAIVCVHTPLTNTVVRVRILLANTIVHVRALLANTVIRVCTLLIATKTTTSISNTCMHAHNPPP
ncbi:hypothetical protein RSOL_399640, partial [Rhizoctonia solani AG-3 Rhs1AP]